MVHGGMQEPTPWIANGMADEVVVAMTPMIISGKSEGPLDIVAWRKRECRILLERAIWSRIKGFRVNLNVHVRLEFEKRSTSQTEKGRGCITDRHYI